MSSQFITHVSSQQPAVVIIGSPSLLLRHVSDLFSQRGFDVVESSVGDLGRRLKSNNFEVYKFVWVHDLFDQPSERDLHQVFSQVKAKSASISHILPIITPIQAVYSQYSDFDDWLRLSQQQNDLVLAINSVFFDAQFVFLQDLVLEHHRHPSHSLYFSTNQVERLILADPEIELHPLDLNSCMSVLSEQLFRPHSAGSVLIRSKGYFSTEIIKKIRSLYQSYHNSDPKIHVKSVQVAPGLPFTVMLVSVESNLNEILSSWTRLLPAPNPEKFQEKTAQNSFDHILNQNHTDFSPQVLPKQPQQQVLKPARPTIQQPAIQLAAQPAMRPVIQSAARPVVQSVSQPKAQSEQPKAKPEQPIQPQDQGAQAKPLERPRAMPPAQDDFDVSQELQKIFKTNRTETKVERIVKTAKTHEKIKKKSKRKTGLFYGGLGVIGLGLGVLFLTVVFMVSQFMVKKHVALALQEAVTQQEISQKTKENLEKSSSLLSLQLGFYGDVFDSVLLSQAFSLSELSTQLTEVNDNLSQARQSAISLTLFSLGKDMGDNGNYAQNLGTEAQKAYENLSLIQARLQQVELPISNEEVERVLNEFSDKLQGLRTALAVEKQLHPLLPSLFGQDSRKTYAIIFQNDQEIRPTGGFIEAIALLKFEGGRMISYDVYSSYEIDQKLVGSVAPPEEISKYLNEENWYFRDSNWDPHFPATARKIAWFIEKSEGSVVDGVIAMNTKTATDLIEALGPIDLPQFNETITHRNLAERLEFHSEVVLVDSSDAQYYPKVILSAVVDKLANLQPEKVTGVLSVFYDHFQNQQLLISVFDQNTQETLANLGWTGEIINPACPTQISGGDCVVDELAQIEANVGVNKANYYLDKHIDHQIVLGESSASHKRTISYTNNAQSNAWPKGSYRAYIRFYLPHDAQLSSVVVGGQELSSDQLVLRQELGRPLVGLVFEVATSQTKFLELNYSTPLSSQNEFSYAFFDQEQSGVDSQSHVITITPRNQQSPAVIAPHAEIKNNAVVFSELQPGHDFVGLKFN